MSTHKNIDRICVVALVLSLVLTLVFVNGEALGLQASETVMGYEDRLFDTSAVHTIDIIIDDWDTFLSTAQSEEYSACSVVIDGEAFKNVGIRGKGNTSLSTVSSMESDRYSFKIEFDQYDTGKTYHGLDKLSLNNLIQDSTYMKDYLTYRMMNEFGAAAPLCSFAYITVNGEAWGLYLAVEAIEEAFLQRNFGADYGELYKPDSMNMGGGRGNGRDFNMEDFMASAEEDATESAEQFTVPGNFDPAAMSGGKQMGGRGGFSSVPEIDEEALAAALAEQGIDPSILEGIDFENLSMENIQQFLQQLDGVDLQALMKAVMDSGAVELPGKGSIGGMGGDDAKLQYVDDDPSSYTTIFDSAKTDVSDADQARLIKSLKALGSGDVESALDVDAVLRYFVVHNYVVNGDSYTGSMVHNYYLYEEDGKLSMLPWDYNLAFGTFQGNNAASAVNDDIDSPLSVTGSGDRPMADWIFQSEAYTELYHQYFAEFLKTVDIQAIIEEAHGLIAPYVEQDPTAFYSYEEFETAVAALQEFCRLRTESVQNQLNGSDEAVDASHLKLSDMGTMNMGGGGGFGGNRDAQSGTADPSDVPDAPEAAQPADVPQMPDGTAIPGGTTLPEGEAPTMPGGMGAETDQAPGGMAGNMGQMPGDMTGNMGQIPDGMGQIPGGMGGLPGGKTTMTGTESEPAGTAPQMPQGMGASGSVQNGSSLVLLAVSAAALVLGLVFALYYKRRK